MIMIYEAKNFVSMCKSLPSIDRKTYNLRKKQVRRQGKLHYAEEKMATIFSFFFV